MDFSTLFSKANLHALLVTFVVSAVAALEQVISGGLASLTWHVFLYGILGGAASKALGAWLAGTGTPPSAVAGLLLVALLGIGASSCSTPAAQAAPVLVRGPVELAGVLSPGDSLGPYTFTVAPVSGATGYRWTATTSGTNGTWSNVPSGAQTAVPSFSFTLASGGTWDSVSVQLCVTGTSSVRSAKAPACTSWRVLRYLPSPTSLAGDSSRLGPISMMVRVPGGSLPVWGTGGQHASYTVGQAFKACVFWRFGSGHVAPVGPDTTGCGAVAAAQFNPARLNRLTLLEAEWASGACDWNGCLLGLGALPAFPDALLITHRA